MIARANERTCVPPFRRTLTFPSFLWLALSLSLPELTRATKECYNRWPLSCIMSCQVSVHQRRQVQALCDAHHGPHPIENWHPYYAEPWHPPTSQCLLHFCLHTFERSGRAYLQILFPTTFSRVNTY